jgi:hypothetical protein
VEAMEDGLVHVDSPPGHAEWSYHFDPEHTRCATLVATWHENGYPRRREYEFTLLAWNRFLGAVRGLAREVNRELEAEARRCNHLSHG